MHSAARIVTPKLARLAYEKGRAAFFVPEIKIPKRKLYTGHLSPEHQQNIQEAVNRSPKLRKLKAALERQEKPVRKKIDQFSRGLAERATGPDGYLHHEFTEEAIRKFKTARAVEMGKIASPRLSAHGNYVDPENPGHINVMSLAFEDMAKLAHEIQHTLDIRRFGNPRDLPWERGMRIWFEYRAFKAQNKVRKQLGIKESDLPDGTNSPLRAALTYWNKRHEVELAAARKRVRGGNDGE